MYYGKPSNQVVFYIETMNKNVDIKFSESSLFGVVKYQIFLLPTTIREQIVLKRKWNNFI
jgi:hypothetical protein